MDGFLDRFWWLKSKKVWAFVIGAVTLTGTAFQMDVFPYADYSTKLVALIIGFMGSNAVEDGMKARSDASASTTTITTPSPEVTVTTSDEPKSKQPFIGRMGSE